MKKKLIRITTIPLSLDKLLEGQLAFMNSYYKVIAVSSPGVLLNKIGKKLAIPTVGIHMSRKITPLDDIVAVVKLYYFFKKEKPLIVHTHTPKAGIVGMLAGKISGVPIRLHTVAGLPLLEAIGIKRKILNFVERLTYACATKVYPNSFGLQDIIIKQDFTKKEKLKVLANGSSNGINTTYFNPNNFSVDDNSKLKKELNIHENDVVFIFVGRLVGDKGINELVLAFKKLSKFPSREGLGVCKEHNQQSTTKLLLVGPLETDLDPLNEATLKEIKENQNIIAVGYQQDVRPYISISNVLVFPSYREGFPNVVMQAGAMGLPSIVTNINGCNEIIKEEENGWIIPVKDKVAIFEAMQFVLEHPMKVTQVASKCRSLIVSKYEQQLVWEALLAEYKALEKTHPHPSQEGS